MLKLPIELIQIWKQASISIEGFESYYNGIYLKNILCIRHLPTNYPKSTLKYFKIFKKY